MFHYVCRDHESCRRLVGLVGVIVLACSAATQAEPGKTSQSQGERAARQIASRASADARPATHSALGDGIVEFVPTAKVVVHSQGGVAGAPPAVVFSNTIYPTGIYDPEGDLSNGFFHIRVGSAADGAWNADDWHLAFDGTNETECAGTSLNVAVYGGGLRCHDAPELNACTSDDDCPVGECTPSPDFDVTVDVFNHDPSFAADDLIIDSACIAADPGVGAFSTDFQALDGQFAHVLTIGLGGAAIGGPNGAIWVRVRTSTDCSGWILGSNAETATPAPPANDAEVGFSDDFGAANNVPDNFCGLYDFIGFLEASYWGSAFCESAITVALRPAFATGLECPNGAADDPASCDWYIDGPNSIVLHRPGQDISSELFLSDWDQGGVFGLVIGVTDTSVDCATFASGKEGTFRTVPGTSCPGGDFGLICNGVDQNRPDYIFADADAAIGQCSDQGVCAEGQPGFARCGSVAIAIGDAGLDTGTPVYGNTFGFIDEDGNARGTFLLGISPDPNSTYVRDLSAQPIAPISRIPMRVVVVTGACCGDPNAPLLCSDDVLFDECTAVGGSFFPGGQCEGVEGPIGGQDSFCSSISRPNPNPELGLGVVAGGLVQTCNDVSDCASDFGFEPNVDCIPDFEGNFPGTCYTSAARYLSISPNPLNKAPTARRVVLDTNDNGTYDPGVDAVLGWMAEPFSTIVAGPEPSPQAQARLQETSSGAYRNWNDLTDVDAALTGAQPVHLGDCEITPVGSAAQGAVIGNTYFIQAINFGADEGDEANYSIPLRLRTTTRHGDPVGTGTDGNYPNQSVSLLDAFAAVKGFGGIQLIPKWRLEMTGTAIPGADNVPDFGNINLADVFDIVGAFVTGGVYPYSQPCACDGQSCP